MARFTVNSRPHIGTWSGGNAWIDTNGNGNWDPNNTDASNRDLSYAIGYTSDKDFAGNFAVPTRSTDRPATASANGFSKLSAYGLVNGTVSLAHRQRRRHARHHLHRSEPTSTASPSPATGTRPARPPPATTKSACTPAPTGTCSRAACTATAWAARSPVPVWQRGLPDRGRLRRRGHVDLATYDINTETFYFQLWDAGDQDWDIDSTINVGGDGIQLGANTRPVAADMDQDGITDIGLYTPVGTGGTSGSSSDWYFWLSNDPATNTRARLDPDADHRTR